MRRGVLPQVLQVIPVCGQRETVFVPPGERTAGLVMRETLHHSQVACGARAPDLSKARMPVRVGLVREVRRGQLVNLTFKLREHNF